MNIKHVLAASAVVWAGVCWPLAAQPAAACAPQKRPLVFPVLVAPPGAQPARSLEAVVDFGPAVPAAAVAFSPDGKMLAVGGFQEVLLWDLAGAALAKRIGLGQLTDQVQALAFHKDGRLLAVGEGVPHGPGAVKLFEVETGQPVAGFAEPKDVVYSLAWSPDGRFLAAGGADAQVRVWSLDEKKLLAELKEHSDWVVCVCFSADGKFLASASADQSVQVWEPGSWKPLIRLQQTDAVHGCALNPDGQLVALSVGGPADRAIRIRRRENGEQVRVIDLGAPTPLGLLWASQTNRLYVPCSDRTIKVFDAGNGALVANLAGHADWVYGVALSPDATKLASASADGTVKLWSAAEGRLLATLLQAAPRTDQWLVVTPEGFFAASSPGLVQWRIANLTAPPDKLTALLHNPDPVRKAMAGEKVQPPALQ
ncbi:MAG: WD40 repeat domain-containing protein [Thermoguttaceae bacterium]